MAKKNITQDQAEAIEDSINRALEAAGDSDPHFTHQVRVQLKAASLAPQPLGRIVDQVEYLMGDIDDLKNKVNITNVEGLVLNIEVLKKLLTRAFNVKRRPGCAPRLTRRPYAWDVEF